MEQMYLTNVVICIQSVKYDKARKLSHVIYFQIYLSDKELSAMYTNKPDQIESHIGFA